MTKAELIDRIARSRDLPPDITKKIVTEVLDLAFAELGQYFVRAKVTRSSSPRFTFPKFGTFTKKKRPARRGVHPRTLEPIEIEASETIDFKPSIELKRQLAEGKVGPSRTSPRRAAAAKPEPKAPRKPRAVSSGLGGRTLATREDVDLDLPRAPLQRVGRKLESKPKTRKRSA